MRLKHIRYQEEQLGANLLNFDKNIWTTKILGMGCAEGEEIVSAAALCGVS